MKDAVAPDGEVMKVGTFGTPFVNPYVHNVGTSKEH